MGYYAAFLDVGDRRCLVVGGGGPAEDKVRGLLDSGARVIVCSGSPDGGVEPSAGIEDLAAVGRIELLRRDFEAADLEGCALVIDTSGDDPSGVRVAAAAREHGVLVNVLDRPALCDFIAPALVRRGPLQVAISTAGRSPFLASHVRKLAEGWVGPEWGELVELVGELRDRLRRESVPLDEQNRVFACIPGSGALEMLREGRRDEARSAVWACAENHSAAGG
jgi:precorrin-2 dehydrogenase / sirohydrochlorin ferrochelatase